MSKVLTVYYSRKGENYLNGSLQNLEKGNTEIVAKMIQGAVGGDIFEIEPVKTYPVNYAACTEEAKSELRAKERVAVKNFKDDLEDYDIIFVGYPNWWGTMPMVMYTFMEHYDLSGKKIVPFCTHEGSGMGRSERDLEDICSGATVMPGLSVYGSKATQSENKVNDWANKMV